MGLVSGERSYRLVSLERVASKATSLTQSLPGSRVGDLPVSSLPQKSQRCRFFRGLQIALPCDPVQGQRWHSSLFARCILYKYLIFKSTFN